MSILNKNLQAHKQSGLTLSILLLGFSFGSALAVSEESFEGLLLAQNNLNSTSRAISKQYGPVKKGENLWLIAKDFLPGQASMAQVVMSIFNRNPQAFLNGNSNLLKTDVMLEIPSDSEIRTLDYRDSYNEFNQQVDAYEEILIARKEKIEAEKVDQISVLPGTAVEPGDVVGAGPVDAELGTIEVIEAELESIKDIKAELEEEQKIATAEPVAEVSQVEAKPAKKSMPPEQPLFRYSYDISVADDDNVRRAQNNIDIRSDLITSFTLNARGGMPLDALSLMSYGGSITYDNFDVFDDLNNLNFNINAKYRFSTSAGFTSPVYSIGVKLGGIESESEMRDSTTFAASFDMNKWITTAISMTTGLGYKLRESKSDVFDTSEGRVFINFDLNLSKAALIYGTYTYIRGDIVSSATPSLAIINAADVIESDDAFGGFTTNQFAYRIDAESQVFTLGYNHIMTRSISIDLSYRYIDSEATEDSDIYYDRTILRASLLGRF